MRVLLTHFMKNDVMLGDVDEVLAVCGAVGGAFGLQENGIAPGEVPALLHI